MIKLECLQTVREPEYMNVSANEETIMSLNQNNL